MCSSDLLFCQAACPLNVDGREVCRRLGAGDSNGALAALLRALPLSKLLTRLCEQPCQAGCKRKDLGGAIEMRALEFSDNTHRSYDIRQPFSRSTVHSGDSSTDTGACVESKERFAFCSRLSRRLCLSFVAALLFNPVTLNPGEALFVPAGCVHAYISGLGVEIMASSDNVLRAGLTRKHVDIPRMLACVDYVAAPPVRPAPEYLSRATRAYYAPVDDFELMVTTVVPEDGRIQVPGRGPRILLGTLRSLRSTT